MTLEKSRVPVVPLRGLAVLPGEVIHCDIGRKKTLSAIEQALSSDGLAMFCAQADPKLVDVQPADFASVGTVCRIRQVFRIQGDTIRLLVTGVARARIEEMVQSSPCFLAEVSYPAEHEPEDAMAEALRRSLGAAFGAFAEMQNRLTTEQRDNVLQTQGFGAFTDAIGRNVAVRLEDKQALLEEPDAEVRALSLLTLIRKEMEIMQMERRIAGKVKEAVEQNQRGPCRRSLAARRTMRRNIAPAWSRRRCRRRCAPSWKRRSTGWPPCRAGRTNSRWRRRISSAFSICRGPSVRRTISTLPTRAPCSTQIITAWSRSRSGFLRCWPSRS